MVRAARIMSSSSTRTLARGLEQACCLSALTARHCGPLWLAVVDEDFGARVGASLLLVGVDGQALRTVVVGRRRDVSQNRHPGEPEPFPPDPFEPGRA